MGRPKKIIVQPIKIRTFEEALPEIIILVNRHRHKWHLTSVPSVGWEDIFQILITHLYIKFHLFDQSRSLGAWVNQVVHNRLINALRDHYSGFARPCLRCPHYQGDTLCSLYGEVTEKCALYAGWMKSKRNKYNIQIPLPMENHINECHEITQDNLDIDRTQLNINERMKKILKPLEWLVYEMLYIKKLDEEEICKKLRFKTSSETNRYGGYGRLSQIKKIIIQKVKEELNNGEIEIIKN